MQLTEETGKKLLAELRESNSHARRVNKQEANRVDERWARVADLKRLTVWKNREDYRRARDLGLVKVDYLAIIDRKTNKQVTTTRYDLDSIAAIYRVA